jgi:hypothetical protein
MSCTTSSVYLGGAKFDLRRHDVWVQTDTGFERLTSAALVPPGEHLVAVLPEGSPAPTLDGSLPPGGFFAPVTGETARGRRGRSVDPSEWIQALDEPQRDAALVAWSRSMRCFGDTTQPDLLYGTIAKDLKARGFTSNRIVAHAVVRLYQLGVDNPAAAVAVKDKVGVDAVEALVSLGVDRPDDWYCLHDTMAAVFGVLPSYLDVGAVTNVVAKLMNIADRVTPYDGHIDVTALFASWVADPVTTRALVSLLSTTLPRGQHGLSHNAIPRAVFSYLRSEITDPDLIGPLVAGGVSGPDLVSFAGGVPASADEALALARGVPARGVWGHLPDWPPEPGPPSESLVAARDRLRHAVDELDRTDARRALCQVAAAEAAASWKDRLDQIASDRFQPDTFPTRVLQSASRATRRRHEQEATSSERARVDVASPRTIKRLRQKFDDPDRSPAETVELLGWCSPDVRVGDHDLNGVHPALVAALTLIDEAAAGLDPAKRTLVTDTAAATAVEADATFRTASRAHRV